MHASHIKVTMHISLDATDSYIQMEGDGICFCPNCTAKILKRSSILVGHYLGGVIKQACNVEKENIGNVPAMVNDFCKSIATTTRQFMMSGRQ